MTIHIVVEGPDGGGKTTLLEKIFTNFNVVRAPRASDSKTGPKPNLAGWVEDTQRFILTPHSNRFIGITNVFDRHAIISEPIYSVSIGRPMSEMFRQPWWIDQQRQALCENALVIFCLPSLTTLRQNVEANAREQMPGVVENLHEIYQRYVHCWQNWPGPSVRYDYNTTDTAPFLNMIGKWIDRG